MSHFERILYKRFMQRFWIDIQIFFFYQFYRITLIVISSVSDDILGELDDDFRTVVLCPQTLNKNLL